MCSIVMLVDKGSISAIPSSSLVTKWTTGISACSRESGGEVLPMKDLGLLLDGKRIPVNYLNPVLDRVRKKDGRFNLCPLLGASPSLDLCFSLWWVTCFLVGGLLC